MSPPLRDCEKIIKLSTIRQYTHDFLQPIHWDDLDHRRQAKLAYLIVRHQIIYFKRKAGESPRLGRLLPWNVNFRLYAIERTKSVTEYSSFRPDNDDELLLLEALDATSAMGGRLEACLYHRDDLFGYASACDEAVSYEAFLEKLPSGSLWKDSASAWTIFNHVDPSKRLVPMYHFQTQDGEISRVLAYALNCISLLCYGLCLQTDTGPQDAIKPYAPNVRRRRPDPPDFLDEMVCAQVWWLSRFVAQVVWTCHSRLVHWK
jgi:hypothetical protein